MPPPLPYLTMFLRMDQTVSSGAATGHKRPFEDQSREGVRAFTLEPPHKRRSNLFVQYGEDRSTQNEQRPAAFPSSQGLQPPRQSLLVIRRPTERPSPQIIKSEAEKITEEPTGPPSPVSVRSDASSSSPSMKPQQRERTSRYLSEGDRRDIISRIDQGEKQVALAKEYQVSRAAICNLYKNREEVMTRANRNPKAKHPKRTKAERTASATGTNKPVTLSPKVSQDVTEDSHSEHGSEEFSSSESGKDESVADETSSIPEEAATPREEPRPAQPPPAPVVRLYDASSSSYPIQRMIHVLRNQDLPVASYRRVAQRFIRNFLEEVVACLPRNEMEAPDVDGSVTSALLPLEDENVCGVSIEEQGMSMLQAFTDIFATAQTGFLNVSRCTGIASSSDCWVVQNRMAPMSSSNITVVLDISCTTGNRACTALHHLVSQRGLNPANIYFASLVTTQPAVNRISREFPGVTLVTAAVEENTTDNHTGLSSFLARYWNQRC